MINPNNLMRKAKGSGFYLWLLNRMLWRMVPFNKPHKLVIEKINDRGFTLKLPYVRKNLNHIKGLHACALAALSEYVTGLTLLTLLDFKQYRIIMKGLKMEYQFQGKSDALVQFTLSEQWITDNVVTPLEKNDSTEINCEVYVKDITDKNLCTGNIQWQIKRWDKVKTSV